MDASVRFGTAVIDDTQVFVAAGSQLVSLHAASGEVEWASGIGAPVTGRPAVGTSTVYVADEKQRLSAIDRTSGHGRWRAELPGAPVGAPIVIGRAVVVPLTSSVVGFDAAEGFPRFEVSVSGIPSPPIAADGLVVFGDGNGDLRAVDDSGQLAWQTGTDHYYVAYSVQQDLVAASGFGGPLVGLDAATGKQRWVTEIDVGWAAPSTDPGGATFWVRLGDHLRAFDAATGAAGTVVELASSRISTPPDAWQYRPTVGPQGLLYVEDPVDDVVAIYAPSGTQVWAGTAPDGLAELTTGWTGNQPVMIIVERSRQGIRAITVPARELPPLPDQPLEPGQPCPVTPLQDRPYATVAAGRYIEVRGLGTGPSDQFESTFVLDTDEREGPLTVRGRRLDGPGTMTFSSHFDDPSPQTEITLDGTGRLSGRWPPHWGVVVNVDDPGCWAYLIDGPDYTDHITVHIPQLDRPTR